MIIVNLFSPKRGLQGNIQRFRHILIRTNFLHSIFFIRSLSIEHHLEYHFQMSTYRQTDKAHSYDDDSYI